MIELKSQDGGFIFNYSIIIYEIKPKKIISTQKIPNQDLNSSHIYNFETPGFDDGKINVYSVYSEFTDEKDYQVKTRCTGK